MNSNAIYSAAACQKTGNLIPIAGNWVIDSIYSASYCACRSSPPSHMLYVFGAEPLVIHHICRKIIPSKLDTCKINEMFNFNTFNKIGIDATHGVFH